MLANIVPHRRQMRVSRLGALCSTQCYAEPAYLTLTSDRNYWAKSEKDPKNDKFNFKIRSFESIQIEGSGRQDKFNLF